MQYICQYCGKECKNKMSLSKHEQYCLKNPNHLSRELLSNNAIKMNKVLHDRYKEQHIEDNKIEKHTFICKKCKKNYELLIKHKDYISGNYPKYCSINCRNSHIVSDDTKQKISKSLNIYHSEKPIILRTCKCCGKQYKRIKGISTLTVCSKECSEYMRTHRKEFLSEDTIKKLSDAGKKAANNSFNLKRSKAEIYFANLCKNKYNNVLTNERIFNGWDADIILPDFKIAVLYNGKWHYEEISKKVSLAQIQNRDKIKIKEIENCNYVPYIIKDLNKFNKEFVEEQFKIFSNYIDNLNKETLDTK